MGVETGESKEQYINFCESLSQETSKKKLAGMFLLCRLKNKGNKDSSLNADVMPGVTIAGVKP